jgi:hypothetical protein
MKSIPDGYEFEQMLAEAKTKLGKEILLPMLRETAEEFGWPLPSEGREKILLRLALLCRFQENWWLP